MVLQEQFGAIDIYLLDQLLRGRIRPGMRIFDAGCGGGRNLHYFLREGYEVYGVDADERAIASLLRLARGLGVDLPDDRVRVEPLEALTFPDGFADVAISSAVLHFAEDDRQFAQMLRATWRTVRPGGLFFCRLASSIGIADRVVPVRGRRCRLPDGTERYLVDEDMLLALTRELGGELLDPLKTTVVQDQRSMTTWVLRKPQM